jgi:hypothetical protein
MPMWSGSGRHVSDGAVAHTVLGNYVVRENLTSALPPLSTVTPRQLSWSTWTTCRVACASR